MNANTGEEKTADMTSGVLHCDIFRPCDVFAHCTNNIGSYECTCFPGYEGDGHTCQGRTEDRDDDSDDGVITPEICREFYPFNK